MKHLANNRSIKMEAIEGYADLLRKQRHKISMTAMSAIQFKQTRVMDSRFIFNQRKKPAFFLLMSTLNTNSRPVRHSWHWSLLWVFCFSLTLLRICRKNRKRRRHQMQKLSREWRPSRTERRSKSSCTTPISTWNRFSSLTRSARIAKSCGRQYLHLFRTFHG